MAYSLTNIVASTVLIGLSIYIWLIDRAMARTPREAKHLAGEPWTTKEIRDAYRRVLQSPTDVKPFLFPKRQRRYVVTGGSGLVGGWMVQHLLMRGEDPAAIRIMDLRPPTRPEVAENKIAFFQTDVSDPASVSKAFNAPWNPKVAKLPLTVFHTVAYINAQDRKADLMPMYLKVNVQGTQNVLDAAKAAGCTCFVATSSASVGMTPPNYFAIWSGMPTNYLQLSTNAEPRNPDGPLSDFGSCYAYSKILAEKLVRKADNPSGNFRTGCIRPGQAIYGHGVENPSSITWDYLRRGGAPSWIWHIVTNFVNAQNVSVAHLAYENTLLNDPSSQLGGRAYCCTDPNPPIRYGDMYRLLMTLAHPMKPVNFPEIPPGPIMLIAYLIEAYSLLRHRYLTFLPRVGGDLALLQPAILQMSTMHIIYDDKPAQEDIGYRAPIETLEGFCHQLVYWNEKVEEQVEGKVAEGKGGELEPASKNPVPKAPNVH